MRSRLRASIRQDCDVLRARQRALLETGVEIDVFAIAPLEAGAWKHSLDLLGPKYLPRNRIHHVEFRQALKLAGPVLRGRLGIAGRDAVTILRAAAPYGPVTIAKTAYALPKAWAWAAQYTQRFDHVLGYWGNYAATAAYAFHRLATPRVPFSIWLHAGTDLYRAPVFMRQKLAYADNVLTCCEFNQTYIFDRFGDVPGIRNKLHICHHGLNLSEFPSSSTAGRESPARRRQALHEEGLRLSDPRRGAAGQPRHRCDGRNRGRR